MESKKVLLLATYSISLARKKEREDEALNANFIRRRWRIEPILFAKFL